MKILLPIMLFLTGGTLSGADLGRYQVILDRQLLGKNPGNNTPQVVATPKPIAPPSWALQYRMTMMTMDQLEGTVRIGLQNIQDQSSVLLIEGKDRHPDFKLVSADYLSGSAQISYQGMVTRFELQEMSAIPIAQPPASKPAERAPTARSSRSAITRRTVRTAERNPPSDSSSVQIRRFASQEELKKHLEAQQMDAIRTGKPPLPIPLTPAMDAQLVREGVLPAQEQTGR